MNRLYVFYDAECGLCARMRRWMEGERAHLEMQFVPYDSEQARALCPDLLERGGDREIVVMADDGRLWQGGDAWVTCLWALRRWRRWSRRLAKPPLRPLAGRICALISSQRLTLSQLLRLRSERDLMALTEAVGGPSCDGGRCSMARAKELARKGERA